MKKRNTSSATTAAVGEDDPNLLPDPIRPPPPSPPAAAAPFQFCTSSRPFECEGQFWRVIVFPTGYDSKGKRVSVFLGVCPRPGEGGEEEGEVFGKGLWATRYARFRFSFAPWTRAESRGAGEEDQPLEDPEQLVEQLRRETSKRFHTQDLDWGFRDFASPGFLFYDLKASAASAGGGDRDADDDDSSSGTIVCPFVRTMYDPTWQNMQGQPRFPGEMLFPTGRVMCGLLQLTLNIRNDPYLVDPLNYDSKTCTGFVGLRNQGCTCYLNSLLQTLFHLKRFRKLVYNSLELEDTDTLSIALALQKLFYRMQCDGRAVGTRELTASFGWDTNDAFLQHDVQELWNILFDRLENRSAELGRLFRGTSQGYIRCTEIDYESVHSESFSTICVNVSGCRNLLESMRKYTEEELLCGENQYDTGQQQQPDPSHETDASASSSSSRYQDAKRGIVFEHLPSVLIILLKRFEYDMRVGTLYKVNDRFEFPSELDLSEFVVPENRHGLDDADEEDVNLCQYDLFSVMVHSGGIDSGHYWACIRPHNDDGSGPDGWYRFDDEKVYEVSESEAIQENFGYTSKKRQQHQQQERTEAAARKTTDEDGDSTMHEEQESRPPPWYLREAQWQSDLSKYTNAYMLVYLKRKDAEALHCTIDVEKDIPAHLPASLLKEREEEARRKDAERNQHKYVIFHVGVGSMLFSGGGSGSGSLSSSVIRGGLGNPIGFPTVRILKEAPLSTFRGLLADKLGIPVEQQFRLWKYYERRNYTFRPSALVVPAGADHTRSLNEFFNFDPCHEDRVCVLVEEPPRLPLHPAIMSEDGEDFILLFFKFYDPRERRLSFLGFFPCNKTKTLEQMAEFLHALTNGQSMEDAADAYSSSAALSLPIVYEEVTKTKVVQVDIDLTLTRLNLGHGDILVYQKKPTLAQKKMKIECLEIPQYYRLLRNQRDVLFKEYQKTEPWMERLPKEIRAEILEEQKKKKQEEEESSEIILPVGGSSSSSSSSDVPVEDGDLDSTVMDTTTTEEQEEDAADHRTFRFSILRNDHPIRVAELLGETLDRDPDYLRLWPHNDFSNAPLDRPVLMGKRRTFYSQLAGGGKVEIPPHLRRPGDSPKLKLHLAYYEILRCPLRELRKKRKLLVIAMDERCQPLGARAWHRVDNMTTDQRMEDLFARIKTEYNLASHVVLRGWEIGNFRLVRPLFPAWTLDCFKSERETHIVRVEIVPERQLGVENDPHRSLIHCVHVDSGASEVRLFGHPFAFLLAAKETLADLKIRLREFLNVGDVAKRKHFEEEDFPKWQFVPVCGSLRFDVIRDDDDVWARLQQLEETYSYDVYLGLLHRDSVSVNASGGGGGGRTSLVMSEN